MKWLLSFLVFTLAAAPGVTGRQASSQPQAADDSSPMPALTLHDFKGRLVPPERYKGKILVVDFWATWCTPCIAEVPRLNRLEEKYSSKGVKVIGVTMASGAAKEVRPYIDQFNIKYTVLMGDDNQAYDLNIYGFPTTYVVTRDGKIFRKIVGIIPGKTEQLESDLEKLLFPARPK